MSVGVRNSARIRRARGFSLLEVVVAAGLLLLTVVAVTGASAAALRSDSRTKAAMAADRLMRAEVERLSALPYCAASYPASTEEAVRAGEPAGDLVGEVFPHAVVAANLDSARYVGAGLGAEAPEGAFVSTLVRRGAVVTRTARFVAADGSHDLAPADLEGWAVWDAARPPASILRVTVAVALGTVRREYTLVREALPAPVLVTRSPA